MLTLLSMALAGEELPDALPLSISLLPPESRGRTTTLALVLHNPNPVPRAVAISADTLQVTAGGAPLSPRWSVQTAEVGPGERMAIFGQVALPAGDHTLKAWLREDGLPGDRPPDAALDVSIGEVGHG